jgi:hypothetical protein
MPGESIAELGDDIRQLAQKAYCNLDIAVVPLSQFSTVLKMGQIFLPAVPPNIRFRF